MCVHDEEVKNQINTKELKNETMEVIFDRLEEQNAAVDEYDYIHESVKNPHYCLMCDMLKNEVHDNICQECLEKVTI